MSPERHDWPAIIGELVAAGYSLYYIAKVCANDDRHKVRRWREGRSKPDADEGPLLLELYSQVRRESSFVT